MKRNEIIAAIIGALLSGLISLSFGIWKLDETYQRQFNKDLRYALKRDINILRLVEQELDHNLDMLLNDKFKIEITFEEATKIINKIKTNDMRDFIILSGQTFIVKKYIFPKERFITGSWQLHYIPSNNEIDFNLIDSLNSFYRKIDRINYQMDYIESIISSFTHLIPLNTKNQIEKLQKLITDDINKISNKDILRLKNEIHKETELLQQKLRKLE